MQTMVQRFAGFARETTLHTFEEIGKLKGKAGIAYGRLTGSAGNAGGGHGWRGRKDLG